MTPGTFFQQVTPQQADVSQPWASSLELYITPWGFLKGAAENNATATRRRVDGKNYTVLTWSPRVTAPSGKNYVVNGYVNDQNLVERVETWLGDNIMGDMHIVATYSGWKDFGGVMAPSKIVQTRGGWPFFEVDCDGGEGESCRSRVAGSGTCRAAGGGWCAVQPAAGGRGGRQRTSSHRHYRKLGDGRLPTHHWRRQLRFADRGLQRPHHDARGRTIRGACLSPTSRKRRSSSPNKPIRYVMNTHAHADHTGGLPAMVAEGATIITQKNNEAVFRESPEHATNAAERHSREESEEGTNRGGFREEGVLGWNANGRDVPRLLRPLTRTA